MLILTRKPGESIYIGDDVKVTVVEVKGNQIRVGIDAPKERRIYREEIFLQILEENKQAAESSDAGLTGLPNFGAAREGSSRPGLSRLQSSSGSKQTADKKEVEVLNRKRRGKDSHE